MGQDSAWRPVFAALSNPVTRQVYASIVLGKTENGPAVSSSRHRHAVLSLLECGLIEEQGGRYVASETFTDVLRTAPRAVRRLGVDRFLTAEGRIDRYPAKPDDRAALLRHVIAGSLQPGEVVTEAELNNRLARFADDVATLRRYLVDHQLVERRADGTQYTLP